MIGSTSTHDSVTAAALRRGGPTMKTPAIDTAQQSGHSETQHSRISKKQTLAAIVPAYDEMSTVAALLQKLCQQPCISQVAVVDDGSDDGTWQAICDFAEQFSVDDGGNGSVCDLPAADADSVKTGQVSGVTALRGTASGKLTRCQNQCDAAIESWQVLIHNKIKFVLVKHKQNRGKGRSIRTGLEYVTASHVIIQDADLEYDPEDINQLWEVMMTSEADVVYGSRYLLDRSYRQGRLVLQSGIRLLNFLCRYRHGVQTTDEATCYKMFRSADLRAMGLECEHFEFCPEVTKRISPMGLRFAEVPVRYQPRTHREGKKLGILDGVRAIRMLIFQ